MKANVQIEENTLPGTVKWLKEKIASSRFYFSSTKENEPCVVWEFRRIKDNVPVVTKTKVVVFFDAGVSDTSHYRSYNNCALIKDHGNDYAEDSLFEYLTTNASYYCTALLKDLADELVKKLEGDKDELLIEVTVS